MNTRIDQPATVLQDNRKHSYLDRLARSVVLARLQKLRVGHLLIDDADSQYEFGQAVNDADLSVRLVVRDPRFYKEIALGGAMGAGESFMQGYWSCDNLTHFLRLMLQNKEFLEEVDSGLAVFARPARRVLHFLNRNTQSGSRRNISAHYDLGNDFYSLWLDPSMMYSCAYYESADATLEQASLAKLDRICQRLDLSASDRVVEIGTGWGGFAVHAAKKYGCHVTTTTISKEQHDFASERIRQEGLQDKITLLFDDYRDLNGKFDKLVSIEMIEAVGHQFHDTFFKKCSALLKPQGRMLLQAITIADQRYNDYKRSVDFINRYIFPGGCLTSVTDMAASMTKRTDMRIVHIDDIGPHYATTLRAWHDRFFDKIGAVRDMGYSETFVRMWQFYLCYCESAFAERATGTVQMHIMKPGARF